MDFHFKKFLRKYQYTKNRDDLKHAHDFLESERILYKAANSVIVVTEQEKYDINREIKGIDSVEIIPNIHEVSDITRPYGKRRNICFVGDFGNKHNVDAARHFIENIFPFILKRNPGVEFHVIGHWSDKYRKEFKAPNIKVIGSLKNLEEALTYYKLFVCPMTYGAGMKGKIGVSAAAGVPIVTTSIGAEGFPVKDGEECFIADHPVEFAEKCNQCLRDPIVWHNFSVKGRMMIAKNFSPNVIASKLKQIFS
jgi:glycosyltransferase involved in cell wall biosynthesis